MCTFHPLPENKICDLCTINNNNYSIDCRLYISRADMHTWSPMDNTVRQRQKPVLATYEKHLRCSGNKQKVQYSILSPRQRELHKIDGNPWVRTVLFSFQQNSYLVSICQRYNVWTQRYKVCRNRDKAIRDGVWVSLYTP